MLTIWKYPLVLTDVQEVDIGHPATVLAIKNQKEVPVLYARVNTEIVKRTKIMVRIVGTGLDASQIESELGYRYMGTEMFAGGGLVWHFFCKVI